MKRSSEGKSVNANNKVIRYFHMVMVSNRFRALFGFSCILFLEFLLSRPALGCASCGSGGGDPLILYPNEAFKTYLSLAIQSAQREVSSEGDRGEVFGPRQKITALGSLGMRFHQDFFGTLTTGIQVNRRDQRKKSGIVDPSLMIRYTAFHQTFEKPWYPQIQGLLGYKHNIGTSIHSSKEKDLVDVTSSGFKDIKIGVDIWYGMFDFKGGLAYLRLVSLPRTESDGSKNENGITHRWTATVAHQVSEMLKITSGINRQTTEERRYQSKVVADSKIQDHSVFLNLDFVDDPFQSMRLGYVKTALLPSDRLTTQTQTLSLAFLNSF